MKLLSRFIARLKWKLLPPVVRQGMIDGALADIRRWDGGAKLVDEALADGVRIVWNKSMIGGTTGGAYYPEAKLLALNPGSAHEIRPTLLHELRHAEQFRRMGASIKDEGLSLRNNLVFFRALEADAFAFQYHGEAMMMVLDKAPGAALSAAVLPEIMRRGFEKMLPQLGCYNRDALARHAARLQLPPAYLLGMAEDKNAVTMADIRAFLRISGSDYFEGVPDLRLGALILQDVTPAERRAIKFSDRALKKIFIEAAAIDIKPKFLKEAPGPKI